MANPISLPRALVTYAVTVPLALVLGYLLTSPMELPSFSVLTLVFLVLCVPLLMRAHYAVLLFSWNAWICVFFLPGQPFLWMLAVLVSLGFTLVDSLLVRRVKVVGVPAVTYTLLFLALVTLLTAQFRGGIGIHSLGGSAYGGKGYLYILFAIAGYFAISHHPIPLHRASFAVGLFLLSGLTAMIGHLLLFAGPAFYFLFNFFPMQLVGSQIRAEMTGGEDVIRFLGFATAGLSGFSFILGRYGVRGIFSLTHPVRLLFFFLMVAAVASGGFRTLMAWMFLIFVVQFIVEGLTSTKLLPFFVGLVVLVYAALVPLTPRLPLQFQRVVSFLPLEVDPMVRHDAQSTAEWRFEMWRILWPELPRYLLVGKGYALDPTDLYLTTQSVSRGLAPGYENALVSGDYHNGPLSVYVPFGLAGSLGFLCFLGVALRVLYRNHLYGDPSLRLINCLLLSLFIARSIVFLFLFGAYYSEFYQFTGLVGLSVALNGGMKKASEKVTDPGLVLAPA